MNTKLTYIEARDKIWNAYFRDEITPIYSCACFVGNLLGEKDTWWMGREACRIDYENPIAAMTDRAFVEKNGMYSAEEILSMEAAFMKCYPSQGEEKLFAGMLAALEVLKQIHRDRGDYIPEDEPLLTKRTLVKESIS